MPYYVVGYSRSVGGGFDIGEFDDFSEALAAAAEYGAAVPTGIVDAAEVIMQARGGMGDIIWIQRLERSANGCIKWDPERKISDLPEPPGEVR